MEHASTGGAAVASKRIYKHARWFSCRCGEKEKHVSNRRWKVLEYHINAIVACESCGACGRTSARYVDFLMAYGKCTPKATQQFGNHLEREDEGD